MTKKISLFSALLFILPMFTFANIEDDVWSYVFHLEYRGGVIAVAEGANSPYSPIPVLFTPTVDADTSPFYAEIISVRGKTLGRFGIPPPTSIDISSGKSPLELRGPFFANADHVAFYSANKKHLFDISVRKSSFCNDDNTCNAPVGENYINCPLDCPLPANTVSPVSGTPEPPPTQPSITQEVATQTTPTITPISAEAPYVTTSEGATPKNTTNTKAVLSLVGGILIIVFALVVKKVRKNRE